MHSRTEMKIDPNIAANPAYEAVKCDQEDHTYDVVSEGVASRQKRGNFSGTPTPRKPHPHLLRLTGTRPHFTIDRCRRIQWPRDTDSYDSVTPGHWILELSDSPDTES